MTALRCSPLLVVFALSLTGCGDDADDGASKTPVPISLEFALNVGEAPFACGSTYADIGSPPAEFTPTDARFYLHGVELVDKGGKAHPIELEADAFQGDGLALLDFEDGCGPDGTEETNTAVRGMVVPGTFESVRFTLGVPPEQNFIDLAAAAAPLDVTGMFWTWQSGYKFLKLDASSPMEGGGINPFLLHVGAAGCPGTNPQAAPEAPCTFPNTVSYELDGFTGKSSKVVADLADLLAASDLSVNTDGTAPGCMSEPDDPECLTVLPRLGVNDASEQRLFHVE